MSDKQPPSLNLIERMAQRMAKQESAASKPEIRDEQAALLNTQQASRAAPSAVRMEQAAAPTNSSLNCSSSTSGVRAIRTGPTPPLAPEISHQTPVVEKSRNVQLDFRVLRQSGIITPDNLTSALSNEFRGVKRRLLQKARDAVSRAVVNNLVMVTSSLPGEGKTFTSLNLTLSLAAERGLNVLLIDADVVRPSIGNAFKSVPREGLTDLLNGRVANVSDVLCHCVDIPNLSVIFSGGVHANSPELVSSGRMFDLCNDLSKRYPDRIIIVDTPPVLASPEPATLAAYVHQLIMVVAADQTDRHQLAKSLEMVSSCQNISLLFNKAPKWSDGQQAYNYGYYAHSAQASTLAEPT